MIEEGSRPATQPTMDDCLDAASQPGPEPLLPRVFAAIRRAKLPGGGKWWRNRWVRVAVLLVALGVLFGVSRHGIARVRENQVGVEVNNLTGTLALRERVGYHLVIPYFQEFHVLDRTIQRLDLGWRQGLGGAGRDLKLKAADGSSVSLDVVINFKLIPQKAVEVLRRSGPGLRFTETWIEPFARHTCLNSFGQLTTEEMYDATKRNERARIAQNELNAKLGPYGIEVVAVIPGEFRFYKEYEQVIQEKKLADQQVEEQQAQARAALEDQERQLVEANKKAQVRLAAFQGECENRLIQAGAEAEKTKRDADGRYAGMLLTAEAALYAATKQAVGQKATLLAEAEGMEQMRKAMIGDGGLSMIGMEYARHLGKIRFSATPISREPSVHQFAVQPETAAAAVAEPAKPPSRTTGQTPPPVDFPEPGSAAPAPALSAAGPRPAPRTLPRPAQP